MLCGRVKGEGCTGRGKAEAGRARSCSKTVKAERSSAKVPGSRRNRGAKYFPEAGPVAEIEGVEARDQTPLRHWQTIFAAATGGHQGDPGGQAPGGGAARGRGRRAAGGLRRQQQQLRS